MSTLDERRLDFIHKHIIEVENGAFFTPKTWRSRKVMWMFYPTKNFPFFTFEVEEDIFELKSEGTYLIYAEGITAEGLKVYGDLIKRPLITFIRHNNKWLSYEFWACEIYDGKKHVVLSDTVKIIEKEKVNVPWKFR